MERAAASQVRGTVKGRQGDPAAAGRRPDVRHALSAEAAPPENARGRHPQLKDRLLAHDPPRSRPRQRGSSAVAGRPISPTRSSSAGAPTVVGNAKERAAPTRPYEASSPPTTRSHPSTLTSASSPPCAWKCGSSPGGTNSAVPRGVGSPVREASPGQRLNPVIAANARQGVPRGLFNPEGRGAGKAQPGSR